MRRPQIVGGGGVGFNMTPMIDVVFQLIIFFLVSSHLARQESQLELPLPGADSGEKAADGETPRLTVNVLADGSLRLFNRPLTPAEAAARLTEAAREAGPGVEVRIRCDRRAPYRSVEPVLRACAAAGVWNVTFSVLRREDADG